MSKNLDSINATTTQIGTVAENLVMNQIIVHSKGRLSPFIPIADDDGVDLLIYDKKTGCSIPIQVKSTKTLYGKRANRVAFNIRKSTLKLERELILLCVLLSKDLLSIEVAWMLNIQEMRERAIEKKNVFTISANIQEKTKDIYKKYQYQEFDKVVKKLVSEFDLKTS